MRPNPQETVDLITFTEELLNRKLHFLLSIQNLFKVYEVRSKQSILPPLMTSEKNYHLQL